MYHYAGNNNGRQNSKLRLNVRHFSYFCRDSFCTDNFNGWTNKYILQGETAKNIPILLFVFSLHFASYERTKVLEENDKRRRVTFDFGGFVYCAKYIFFNVNVLC